jgi:hypothetical protein
LADNENTLISPFKLFTNTRVDLNAFVAFIHILESLTRFVAQSFYAPKRLIKKIDVVRVPINTKQLTIMAFLIRSLWIKVGQTMQA